VGSIADSNQHVYERRATVSYWTTDLSGPELAIFELYAADIDGKHVLDLGVGAGRTSPFLARRAQRYVGLDYSHRLVSVARKRFPSLDIRHGDARDLTQFAQHSFDFVLFSFNGIDNVEHRDRMQILREIARVLRPGGLFAFSSHDLTKADASFGSRLLSSNTVRAPRQLLNPVSVFKAVIRLLRRLRNFRRNASRQTRTTGHAMLNDEALEFALLQYYVTEEEQKRQLSEVGFAEQVAVYPYPDGYSLYYVARKPRTASA